jgi:hypothetical protein
MGGGGLGKSPPILMTLFSFFKNEIVINIFKKEWKKGDFEKKLPKKLTEPKLTK